MATNRTRWVILAALALLAISALIAWSTSTPSPPEAHDDQRSARATAREPHEHSSSLEPVSPREHRERALRATPEARRIADALRDRIRAARDARLAARGASRTPRGQPAGAPSPSADPARGTMDPEYIRAAIRELVPLVAECYELAREEAPSLEGRLVVSFEIEGEPDVGGVVEDVTVDPEESDPTIQHPLLDECVRETLYTAELPAPEGGGSVTVRYPFVFREEPDEATPTAVP